MTVATDLEDIRKALVGRVCVDDYIMGDGIESTIFNYAHIRQIKLGLGLRRIKRSSHYGINRFDILVQFQCSLQLYIHPDSRSEILIGCRAYEVN